MTDAFRTVREAVSARQAAEAYGFRPNKAGFVRCPFHAERTASLKLYPDGGFHCFGCGAGGSSIDFVMKLFNLDAMGATRKLNEDFGLGLPLDRPLSPAEREKARQEAERRRELSDTWSLFDGWRTETLKQVNAAHRAAHEIILSIENPSDLAQITETQAFAVRWQPWFAYLSDALTIGAMEEQTEIFRMRKEVAEVCSQALSSTPTKSGAA